ncbi:MAG TPA: hypothetical protein VHK90_16100 [Thermoanaerobaculia bacterium]|nr:hypothetical protein [Thermoanaerobaculia bacterium]
MFRTVLMTSARVPAAYSFGTLPAGHEYVRIPELAERTAGRLLYFDRSTVDDVRFFYTLTTTAADGSWYSTTLPVVRERDFVQGTSHIFGLGTSPIYDWTYRPYPVTTGFQHRNHIRVYDPDRTGTLSVTIRVTIDPLSAYGPWAQYHLRVDKRDADDPTYPYYADVQLPDLCIQAPHGAWCRHFGFTIEIEPDDRDARYFVMASATDNVTGHTAVFFPQ